MNYAILIYQADGAEDHFTAKEKKTILEGHGRFGDQLREEGAFVGAIQLSEGYTASTVNRRGAKISVQDGPFSEAKELVIGLYVVQCDSLDEAIAYAAEIPNAAYGTVEVRPIAYARDRAGEFEP